MDNLLADNRLKMSPALRREFRERLSRVIALSPSMVAHLKAHYSPERVRWDIFWATPDHYEALLKPAYLEGLTDNEIDTVLKRIVG